MCSWQLTHHQAPPNWILQIAYTFTQLEHSVGPLSRETFYRRLYENLTVSLNMKRHLGLHIYSITWPAHTTRPSPAADAVRIARCYCVRRYLVSAHRIYDALYKLDSKTESTHLQRRRRPSMVWCLVVWRHNFQLNKCNDIDNKRDLRGADADHEYTRSWAVLLRPADPRYN